MLAVTSALPASRSSKVVPLTLVGSIASLPNRALPEIVKTAARTWRGRDGRPKVHYSDQWPGMPAGTHSASIRTANFLKFYDQIIDLDLDIMFEVKDKERSVLKVIRALAGRSAALRFPRAVPYSQQSV